MVTYGRSLIDAHGYDVGSAGGPSATAVSEDGLPRRGLQNFQLGTKARLSIQGTLITPTTMDLDDFDAAVEQLPLDVGSSNAQSPKDAVRLIDAQWYTPVSRRGRWMDLIGDYAGSEPFVVDGEHVPLI